MDPHYELWTELLYKNPNFRRTPIPNQNFPFQNHPKNHHFSTFSTPYHTPSPTHNTHTHNSTTHITHHPYYHHLHYEPPHYMYTTNQNNTPPPKHPHNTLYYFIIYTILPHLIWIYYNNIHTTHPTTYIVTIHPYY